MRSDLSHKGRGDSEHPEPDDSQFMNQTSKRGFGRPKRSEQPPKQTSVPQECGTHWCCRTLLSATTVHLDAVVLFAMFTTCTRRFTSAVGFFGSLSLVLPYPT